MSRGVEIADTTLPRLVFVASALIFLVFGWWQTNQPGTWHEELAIVPQAGYLAFEPDPMDRAQARLSSHCTQEGEPLLHNSPGRPRLFVCSQETVLPVLTESYMSGVFYWPMALVRGLGGANVFVLRKLILPLGVLNLFLGFLIVRRLSNEATAALASFFAAVSSPFLFLHGILAAYEVTPWTFISLAILASLKNVDDPPPRQMALAGLLVGLAFYSNIKALFLVVPLALVLAWRWHATLRKWSLKSWAAGLSVTAVTVAPMLLLNRFDRYGGFSSQLLWRLEVLFRKLRSPALFKELVNEGRFGADMGKVILGDGDVRMGLTSLYVLAILWCFYHLVQFLRRRETNLLAAFSGALFLQFLLVSHFIYKQDPPANYSPIYYIYPVGMAAFVMAGYRRLSLLVPALWSKVLVAGVILGIATLSTTQHRTTQIHYKELDWSLNMHAQLTMRDYLNQRDPDIPLMTQTYNMAGVPAALTHLALPVTQMHLLVDDCLESHEDEEALDCVRFRLQQMFGMLPRQPVEVLISLHPSKIDAKQSERVFELMQELDDWEWALQETIRSQTGEPLLGFVLGTPLNPTE